MNVFRLHDGGLPSKAAQNNSRTPQDPSIPSVFGSSVFQTLNDPASRPLQFPVSTPQSPELSQQRCYWALLSADLEFMYVDPVMQSDLGGTVVGRSLLEFVHPDEQTTAQLDLRLVLESKIVHGSITQSAYILVQRVLRKDAFSPSEEVYLDEDFIAANLVINLACEGLILCFIHSTIDVEPTSDNGEHVKRSWTNWCSTPSMNEEQLQILSRSLLMCAPQSSHGRVFQILANTSARPSLLTWPPPQEGSSARDITDLAESVDLSGGGSSNSQAKTNCTRRFKASRELHGTEVESVYIPHGSVIFACHKLSTSSSSPTSATHSQTTNPTSPISISPTQNCTTAFMGYNGSSSTSYSLPPPPPHQQPFYDPQFALPPLASSTTLPPPTNSYTYSSGQPTFPGSSPYSYAQWVNTPSHPSVQSLRSGYWNHGSASYENGSSVSTSLPLSGGHQSHGNYGRPLSPYSSHMPFSSTGSHNVVSHLDGLNDDTPSPTSATSPSSDLVPPSRRRISPGLSPEHRGSNGPSGGTQRSHGNRPTGLLKCSSCKTTSSPEWRKGPSGKKELCNACGLRYARSRAKKEGHVVSNSGRKRKDKVIKRESSIPPSATSTAGSITSSYSSSAVVPYHPSSTPSFTSSGSWRRSYVPSYDNVGSFSSGHDIYGASRSVGTPSPSPPAGGFSHYVSASTSDSVGHAHHPTTANRTSYYGSSVPSPLATHPPLLQTQSFERDHRDREECPPTPVSAEPRSSYYEASYDRSEPKDAPRGFELPGCYLFAMEDDNGTDLLAFLISEWSSRSLLITNSASGCIP
ncbi:hypothetical protein F5890DRAFT_1554489 [Lentinula detonsa]|uniref:GATA-type domain-containing protein n=1 Tax=Lentinula detonsa TaxID=2804962 RepID=A0AA38USA8_9AGAR|nr:hypothetical protein F5890DRAFT_1554489 [Lentinula detonsa]